MSVHVYCVQGEHSDILKTKRYCEAVYIYRFPSAATLFLEMTVRSSYSGTRFKVYGYPMVTCAVYRHMTGIQMY